MRVKYLELLQKRDIRILEVAHIRDSVLDHDETVEPEPEGESGVFLGIDPSFPKDIRVDESGTHELDPTGLLADPAPLGSAAERTGEIHFHSRFDERKISGTHSYGDFATEDIGEHSPERILEIRETDVLIDHHPFHLIERILVRRIDVFIPEHPARDKRFERCSFGFHDDILHTGSLSREDISFSLKPERILHVTGRMGRGHVDGIEIPVLGRDLVGFVDIEAHALERVLDFHKSTRNRVEMVSCILGNRSGHILEFGRKPFSDESFFDDHELFLESRSDADLAFVDGFPDGFLILVGEVFDSLEKFGQRSVFPKDSIPEVDESRFGSEFGDLNEGGLFEGVEFLEHKA